MPHYLQPAAHSLFQASWQASVLAIVVLCVCRAFSRLPAAVRCWLWLIVLIRFLMPAVPESSASLFNATKLSASNRAAIADAAQPEATPRPTTVIGPNSHWVATQNVAVGAHEIRSDGASTWADPTWSIAALVWSIGVVILLSRNFVSLVGLRRLLRQCRAATNNEAIAALETSRVEAGIRRPVALLVTAFDAAPALAGIVSPQILVSEKTLESLGPAELRWLFRHELAHARRRDLLIQRFWRLVCTIHWFNPLAWWSASCVRRAAELACDESVLNQTTSSEHAEYGHTLLKVAELLMGARPIPGAIGLLVGEPALTGRIRALTKYRPRSRLWTVGGSALFVVLAFAGLTDAIEQEGNAQQPSSSSAAKPSPAKALPAHPPATLSSDLKTQIDPKELATTKGKIRIRVRKPDGKPLLGARIFANIVHPGGKKWTITDRNYLSDAAGQAVVQLPSKVGVTKIWVSKQGYPELFACWFPGVHSDASVIPEEFTFQPPKMTVIGGVVKSDDGEPIQGVTVAVEKATYDILVGGAPAPGPVFADLDWLTGPTAAKVTDARGRWSRNDLPCGAQEVFVRFSHPDYDAVRIEFGQGRQLQQDIQSLIGQIVMHRRPLD
jgi:beta-lactamase regulating signal transducer with metallopeptidase domain